MPDDKENGNEAGDKAPQALPKARLPVTKIDVKKAGVRNIDVEAYIKAIIVQMKGIDERSLRPDSRFREDLGYSDLDFVEFIYEVQETFGISIPDEVAEKIRTILDAINAVREILGSDG